MVATITSADNRVVVTGIGVVSSVGIGVAEFRAALRAGRGSARPITRFDTTGFDHTMGCEVVGFDAERLIHRHDPAELGRATQFCTVAARLAVDDAGLSEAALRAGRAVVAVGTTDGESADLDAIVAAQVALGASAVDPALARRVPATRLSTVVSRELGLTDVEAVTIPTACAAGNYAIGYGYDAVRAGDARLALCGGADALCRKTFTGFYRLGTIAPAECQPFDRDRRGILTGEGAGLLVLETLASARERGARVYAEILGYALNCDADHPVAPNRDSIARCMRLAHRRAGVEPGEIDFISAHGTGTRANDTTEATAIRQVFGDRPPPTVSVKSMLGHAMGAASALAAAACALAITDGFIPPTINYRHPDPECGLDCVPNHARPARVRVAQNNALAFGGNNAVLLLGRPEAV